MEQIEKLTHRMKGGSLIVNWGKYGGFYIRFGYMKRICLGWIAFTYLPEDFDGILHGYTKNS